MSDLEADMLTQLSPGNASAFLQAAGLVFNSASGDRVTGTLSVGPEHHTPWGVVHGGTYTTAIESAASVGASIAVAKDGKYAVGLNNNTDFLRPTVSAELAVVAVALQQGRTQQLWLVTLTREDGKQVARGQVRLQNVSTDSQ